MTFLQFSQLVNIFTPTSQRESESRLVAFFNQKPSMALSTQEAQDDDQFVLLAIIDNARNVSNILKAIHFKEVRF